MMRTLLVDFPRTGMEFISPFVNIGITTCLSFHCFIQPRDESSAQPTCEHGLQLFCAFGSHWKVYDHLDIRPH